MPKRVRFLFPASTRFPDKWFRYCYGGRRVAENIALRRFFRTDCWTAVKLRVEIQEK